MKIQQFFEDWVISHCQSDFPVILVGANGKNITSCTPWSGGDVTTVPSFRNDHEEADDWMMYHLNQSINEKAIIASADRDVFICAVYHFNQFIVA